MRRKVVGGPGIGLHGQQALHINYTKGSGLVGLGNRGFRNEGLYLQKGKEYEGYLFIRSSKPVTIKVEFQTLVG